MLHKLILLMLSSFSVYSWNYVNGGEDWTGLCASGNNQSPIDLQDNILTHIDSSHEIVSIKFALNGAFATTFIHSKVGSFINFSVFGTIQVNSAKITIRNMHYHAPAEHPINGHHHDLEFHFFGSDEQNNNFGFGVFLEVGKKPNKFVQASIDSYVGGFDQYIDTNWLVENGKLDNFYFYNGSVTNPAYGDCSEIVTWTVIKEPLDISQEQLDFFNNLWEHNKTFAGGHGSNRKVRPLNGRTVYFYSDSNKKVVEEGEVKKPSLFLF